VGGINENPDVIRLVITTSGAFAYWKGGFSGHLMCGITKGWKAMKGEKGREETRRDPGKAMGTWIGIGLALGAGIGMALDNIAIGIGIGLALGAAIGAAHNRKGI